MNTTFKDDAKGDPLVTYDGLDRSGHHERRNVRQHERTDTEHH